MLYTPPLYRQSPTGRKSVNRLEEKQIAPKACKNGCLAQAGFSLLSDSVFQFYIFGWNIQVTFIEYLPSPEHFYVEKRFFMLKLSIC